MPATLMSWPLSAVGAHPKQVPVALERREPKSHKKPVNVDGQRTMWTWPAIAGTTTPQPNVPAMPAISAPPI